MSTLLLAIIFWRFFHVVASNNSLYLFIVELLWMYPYLLIHFLVEGHLGCSQVLAVMNKAARAFLYKAFSKYMCSFFLDKYLGVQLLSQKWSCVTYEIAK